MISSPEELKYTTCDYNYIGLLTNYVMACLFGVLLIIAPFFVAIFYYRNFDKFEDEQF